MAEHEGGQIRPHLNRHAAGRVQHLEAVMEDETGAKAMRRFVLPQLVLVLVLFAMTATPAFADVHGVSQAECAAPGAPSGATTEQSRSAPGRPDAPIPVSASGGRTQGRGDDADAQGTNC
jgi:hypothetical protein